MTEQETSFFTRATVLNGLNFLEARILERSAEDPQLKFWLMIYREILGIPEAEKEFPVSLHNFSHILFDYCVKSIGDYSHDTVNQMTYIGYYFLTERELNSKKKSRAIDEIKNHLFDDGISEIMRLNLKKYEEMVPVDMVRYYFQNANFDLIRELLKSHSAAITEKNNWTEHYKNKKLEIESFKSYLDNMKSDYGFVALKYGFQRLRESKALQSYISLAAIAILVIIMIAIPIMELRAISASVSTTDFKPEWIIYLGIPLIAIQFLLIYFFRIVLGNFRSIQAQLLQLDLRISICQFFESYTEFAEKNIKIKETLTKFESMMFSSIVSKDEAIPSLFDGSEQVIKLIETLRKGK